LQDFRDGCLRGGTHEAGFRLLREDVPPSLVKADNKEVKATVFGCLIDHTGVVETGRRVPPPCGGMEQCTVCPDRESCFRLSTETLLMEIALKGGRHPWSLSQ
jgi:hypothetical protein